MKLLSRNDFRETVLSRDNYCCVICGHPAVDAHHIIERRLFPDGGYYLDNGASVCSVCHLLAEKTIITVEDLRERINAKKCIPPQFYKDVVYDKWGNIILTNGTRLRGELFEDESVQKILKSAGVLERFIPYVKYPRTYHLPWSPGISSDDKVILSLTELECAEVVVTIKMDGENTSLYSDYVHARSIDNKNHPSRSWVKNFHSTIQENIPEGWRVCGENMYAVHSIVYDDLKTYFYGFSIWDEHNNCLSFDDTIEWFSLLNITPVPIIYRGNFDKDKIQAIFDNEYSSHEGYVVRVVDSFHYSSFSRCVAKWVRKNHVITHEHWTRKWKKNLTV